MRKISNIIKHYFNKNLWIIYILGLVLSLIGSFQVYHGRYDNILKEVSVISISVLKLFLFVPIEGFIKQNPLAYELAIWIAPMTTLLATFSIFNKLYTAIKLKLAHFHKEHIIVMGCNDYSLSFMKNYISLKNKKKILCILPERTQEKDIETLNRLGVITSTIDYMSGLNDENMRISSEYNFASVDTIICFEDEPKNYGYLKLISELIAKRRKKKEKIINVYVNTVNKYIRNIVQHKMDEIKIFDIKYFNIYDLIAYNLINLKNFKLYETSGLKKDWIKIKKEKGENFSLDDFSNLIGTPNILLIGFKNCGKSLFELAVNQTLVNAKENMKITIVDRKISNIIEEYKATIRELKKVANIELIDGDINHISTQNKIKESHKKDPFTAVLFSTKNCTESLIFIDLLGEEIFKNVNTAVFCENIWENKPLIESIILKYPNIIIFGELIDVLNFESITNEPLEIKSKEFNAYYNKISENIMNYPEQDISIEEQWDFLSNIKKDSSRNQCMHQNVKEVLLEKIAQMEGLTSVEELLDRWKAMIDSVSVKEQINIIEKNPAMNYMSALEHKRWSSFYYMRNFVYSEKKDEVNGTHNSLIDDWDEFLRSDKREQVIYDFISVFSVK
ncbi:hypothetical protein C7Y58_06660 [Fusobacterium nucleatum subsp. nucleatum ATCC 25586]|uniref:RCK N-terminal domain-containing protein n=1 Tax=Fusobacterium nucleatum subsp. nucleatum (strain ATCC 25586 / DSM 15643 / BCRC 10681 / CIP 101130 / JCM 8532 / KCTC 2640 / LMG 13131 / VPI 4355) TaxID=190304 RepID=Q8RFH5_FUSNN|nr:hypothetical protein [Fusobacterium nucleatum]AAL94919.1 Hypothetical protein FN0723 [Fusobacterium nucleatum subsp. nucleatum ATCC 25586]AVQ15122.1 hypothetical protein C7Y58_06660 [Fusobacterium nucleatum subsp. nucleatum ATCC 25586]WMS30016.1 hypothetical protein RDV57_02885 [Fusobacterium nucleatum]